MLTTEHRLSVRRACRVVGLARATWYTAPIDPTVRETRGSGAERLKIFVRARGIFGGSVPPDLRVGPQVPAAGATQERALDERIDLPRPRVHGDARFAALETRILDRVLQKPEPEQDAGLQGWPGVPATGLRWAI